MEEVVAVCFSLQRIADQALDSEETGRFFYDLVIPRLLTLALQAALQGKQKGFCPEMTKYEAILNCVYKPFICAQLFNLHCIFFY